MKKNKKLEIILWSTLAPASACALVIPMTVLMNRSYVTMTFSDRDRTIKSGDCSIQYRFQLKKTLKPRDYVVEVKTNVTFATAGSCETKVESASISSDGKYIDVTIRMVHSNQSKPILKGEIAVFDINFSVKNKNNKHIWSDKVSNLKLTYNPGQEVDYE